ncbi:hypothetical protein EKN56_05895 [Limnobaculum zhutongyuii]|uniref:Uncharacterized protein n=1 Tax=Limnobaculum zhutongyuii TaxID=2498113 RepID=A0A411WIF7_9GAMM|nr:hypothetical protein [Limnobaculum zhutongyuii]QBH95974.1 hypothetical protein EKN56_05895 [Limnobaculum zhutongyuii]TQS89316.1 hypothetical protein ELQ32_06030 [Limnobaculum zhutongyuii]
MTNLKKKQQNAERKRRQRANQAKRFGEHRLETVLCDREFQALEIIRVRRNPGREPYSRNDCISLLLLCELARLERQEARLGKCQHCGNTLPEGCQAAFKGEAVCWFTRDCRALNLTDVTGHARLEVE